MSEASKAVFLSYASPSFAGPTEGKQDTLLGGER